MPIWPSPILPLADSNYRAAMCIGSTLRLCWCIYEIERKSSSITSTIGDEVVLAARQTIDWRAEITPRGCSLLVFFGRPIGRILPHCWLDQRRLRDKRRVAGRRPNGCLRHGSRGSILIYLGESHTTLLPAGMIGERYRPSPESVSANR